MAYYLIFYDNMYNDKPEFTFEEVYQYAYSLTDYLIMEYGLASYKELCKKCSVKNDKAYKSGEIMNAAVEELFHISLKELEHNWRTSERHKIRHIRHKQYSQ